MTDTKRGLYGKFHVTTSDGAPATERLFILRPDRDPHAATVAAAVDVLRTQGEVVTLERVARRAGTSRRTLASQPALRALLDKAHPDPSSTK